MDKNLLKLVQNSMFVVISLVFSMCINFPVSPVFPFVKFDVSDVPIFLSTMIFGLHYGIMSFFVTLILRTLFFSSAGIVGFFIRLSTFGIIFSLNSFYKDSRLTLKNAFIILGGIFLSLSVKLPISYVLWRCLGIHSEFLNVSFFSFILPFNFFKYLFNVFLAVVFYKKIFKIIKNSGSL